MKAVICDEPGKLSVITQPDPTLGPGEVLVRIRRVGVCGTDMHIFGGNQPFLTYPRIMGHELSGEIAEAPAGSRFKPGDPVYIVPYLSCGSCIACRKAKTNCCTQIRVLGVHIDGGMCEYLCLPEANVHPADGINLDEAAMVEFLAIGAHAVARGQVQPKSRVLVVGAGPIGMGAALFAHLRGAEVTTLDARDDRLSFTNTHLGASNAVKLGNDDTARLEEVTQGEYFDTVFDATGNAKAMERGFGFVAHGGNYVFISLVRADITFNDPEFHKRETTLLGSRNATAADFATVMQAFAAKKVPSAALNTHRAALSELPSRMPEWIKPETGVIKALLDL